MSRGPDLFGSYTPGTSVLHRAPLWSKGLGIVVVTVAVVLAPSWPVPAALTAGLLVAGTAAGVRAREWWRGLAPALPELLDGVVWLCTPVRLVGADPERIGLAVSLMLRSIPFIVGSVGELRDAVRARGLRPGPVRLVTPAVISTVAYAHRTGEALAARGID